MTDNPRPRLRVALIAYDDSGRVLLLQHERVHGKYWVLPGGGVDVGESIEGALVREIMEELSVDCEIDGLAAVGELILQDRHVVDFFLRGRIDTVGEIQLRYEEGISDAGWFEMSQLNDIPILPPEIVKVISGMMQGRTGEIEYLGRYMVGE